MNEHASHAEEMLQNYVLVSATLSIRNK